MYGIMVKECAKCIEKLTPMLMGSLSFQAETAVWRLSSLATLPPPPNQTGLPPPSSLYKGQNAVGAQSGPKIGPDWSAGGAVRRAWGT